MKEELAKVVKAHSDSVADKSSRETQLAQLTSGKADAERQVPRVHGCGDARASQSHAYRAQLTPHKIRTRSGTSTASISHPTPRVTLSPPCPCPSPCTPGAAATGEAESLGIDCGRSCQGQWEGSSGLEGEMCGEGEGAVERARARARAREITCERESESERERESARARERERERARARERQTKRERIHSGVSNKHRIHDEHCMSLIAT